MGQFVAEGRKYHLDWLRVLAFGLLIPFHVGMLYNSWFIAAEELLIGTFRMPRLTSRNRAPPRNTCGRIVNVCLMF